MCLFNAILTVELIKQQGTSPFIALEVDLQAYRFYRPSSSTLSKMTTDPRETALADKELLPFPTESLEPEVMDALAERFKFRYNPLHDMESLWWVAVYLVLKREVAPGTTVMESEVTWDSKAQQPYVRELLGTRRDAAFTQPGSFVGKLKPIVHPAVWPAVLVLDDLRIQLNNAYLDAEKDIPTIDNKCANTLYDMWIEQFIGTSRRADLRDVMLKDFSSDKPKKTDNVPDAAVAATGIAKEPATSAHSRPRLQVGPTDHGEPLPGDGTSGKSTRKLRRRSRPDVETAGGTSLLGARADSAVEPELGAHWFPRPHVEDGKPESLPSETVKHFAKRTRKTKRHRSAVVDAPSHRYNLRPRAARGM